MRIFGWLWLGSKVARFTKKHHTTNDLSQAQNWSELISGCVWEMTKVFFVMLGLALLTLVPIFVYFVFGMTQHYPWFKPLMLLLIVIQVPFLFLMRNAKVKIDESFHVDFINRKTVDRGQVFGCILGGFILLIFSMVGRGLVVALIR